jgi:hypothetical protein
LIIHQGIGHRHSCFLDAQLRAKAAYVDHFRIKAGM